MSDYTPTTEQVCAFYAGNSSFTTGRAVEFYRWLAEHDAEMPSDEHKKIPLRRVSPGFATTKEAYEWLAKNPKPDAESTAVTDEETR